MLFKTHRLLLKTHLLTPAVWSCGGGGHFPCFRQHFPGGCGCGGLHHTREDFWPIGCRRRLWGFTRRGLFLLLLLKLVHQTRLGVCGCEALCLLI